MHVIILCNIRLKNVVLFLFWLWKLNIVILTVLKWKNVLKVSVLLKKILLFLNIKSKRRVFWNIMVSSINSNARYPNNGKDYEEDMIRYGCYSSGKLFVTWNTLTQSCDKVLHTLFSRWCFKVPIYKQILNVWHIRGSFSAVI